MSVGWSFWDETLFAGPRGMFMDYNGRHLFDLKGANAYAARVASELAQEPQNGQLGLNRR
jgi:hypothetical protein